VPHQNKVLSSFIKINTARTGNVQLKLQAFFSLFFDLGLYVNISKLRDVVHVAALLRRKDLLFHCKTFFPNKPPGQKI